MREAVAYVSIHLPILAIFAGLHGNTFNPANTTHSVVNDDHHNTLIAIQMEPRKIVSIVANIPITRNANGAIPITPK